MIGRTIVPKGMPQPAGEEGYALLGAIWESFVRSLGWPTFDDLDRRLYALGLDYEEAVQQLSPSMLRGLDHITPWRPPQGEQELSLTIAGAANCADADRVTTDFLHMVRTAAELEPRFHASKPGERPTLDPEDMSFRVFNDRPMTPRGMFLAASLAMNEPCFRGGSSNAESLSWSLTCDRTIRPFAHVYRLEDYWRIREQSAPMLHSDRRLIRNPRKRPVFGSEPTVQVATPVASPPAAVSPTTMAVTCNLHPLIAEVAAERFGNGFYYDAVRSAFQAVEHRVQILVGTTEVGERLMGIAFGNKPNPPKITVARSTGGSLESEQNGMQFLFKGAIGALRNPRMHGPDEKDARDEAEEMLVFASFLMRRLDIEDTKRKNAAAADTETMP
ncbi:TIGR02391 family protein [Streptomyces sp. NPDC015408]|uniref:TIGR02391 family protein n=1 Tax=Streptomyces sp. NPDC015408 TaxID=3364956 RepID=UPI0036FB30E7